MAKTSKNKKSGRSPAKPVVNTKKTSEYLPVKKALAITLKDMGQSYRKIAKDLELSPNTIYLWLKEYNEGNMDSIVTDIVAKAKPILIQQDLELVKLVGKRIRKEVKDKQKDIPIKELTQLYEMLREGVSPVQTISNSTPSFAIQINNNDKEYTIGTK
jgi:transposase